MKNYIVITTALVAIFILGCSTAVKQAAGPSDTLKTYIDAYDRKDIATMKQTYSKGTIKMYEDVAQKQQTSVDEIIKQQIEVASTNGGLTSKVQTVGEKIEGDTAIVEVKSEGTEENEKIPLVKEDGVWKLALDKYIADIQKRMLEDMNKPNPKSSK
jgi:hypothetical protein